MKNTFVLLFTLFFISASHGQQSECTGPRVKNEKAWKKERKAVVVYHAPEREAITGPKAKNRKVWKKEKTAKQVITRKKRTDVTGPKFKNRKPWKKD